ncbi:MAG: ParA family protein, partial [Chloroflexaceae bacterium]|nr:ParA family protein [Chloroflexaceae bacterium]
CPNCGHPLDRTTIAGYRIAYCNNCRYKEQELVRQVR